MTTELRTVDRPLVEAAIEDGWFVDDDRNWGWGFGRGATGRLRGTQELQALKLDEDASGLWVDDTPCGLFLIQHLAPERRTVQISSYVPNAPEAMRDGLVILTDKLFGMGRDRVFRVQVEILATAKEDKKVLREVGFKEEGFMRDAYWIGINSINVLLFALTRPAWVKLARAA